MQKLESESVANGQKNQLHQLTRTRSTSTVRRTIQIRSGQHPCYRTSERLICKKKECEWRTDCLKLVAVWKR